MSYRRKRGSFDTIVYSLLRGVFFEARCSQCHAQVEALTRFIWILWRTFTQVKEIRIFSADLIIACWSLYFHVILLVIYFKVNNHHFPNNGVMCRDRFTRQNYLQCKFLGICTKQQLSSNIGLQTLAVIHSENCWYLQALEYINGKSLIFRFWIGKTVC